MLVILLILAGIALGPVGPSIKSSAANGYLQRTRSINLLLFSYANDHDGTYPDGQSSTEVFQKLLDEKYCDDPEIFYMPYSGKVPPKPGQKLKPENVSFDVTSGVDSNSLDRLPIVFMTGYKVNYVPGGVAVPMLKSSPRIGWEEGPGFVEWLTGWRRRTIHYSDSGGITVAYKSNSTMFLRLQTPPNSNSVIPNFISPDFKPDGRTYRQLTPDGPVP